MTGSPFGTKNSVYGSAAIVCNAVSVTKLSLFSSKNRI